MKHYATWADGVFGLVLLVTSVVLFLLIASTLAYFAWLPTVRGLIPWGQAKLLLPFGVFIAFAFVVRRRLLGGRVPNWGYQCLLATLCVVVYSSRFWFMDPMHDITLFFGSHGRWGCRALNPDGTPYYLVRDETAPWLLFTPPALVTLLHWIWTRL
jgi:hypothetical protein